MQLDPFKKISILILSLAVLTTASTSYGSQCLGFYDAHFSVGTQLAENIRHRVHAIRASSRANSPMPELKSLIDDILHQRLPERPRKFKTKADQQLSNEIHALILSHRDRLQSANWPYREMHYFFYLLTRYHEMESYDMPGILNLASARSLTKHLAGTDEAYIIEDVVSYFPKFMLLPYAHLGSLARMNELAGDGLHLGVVLDKRSNIDGNPYETPAAALGHDYGHFQLLNKSPDLVFWKKMVSFINSQPDPVSRETMHALFFHIWHELPIQINARQMEYALTTGGLAEDAHDSMKKSQYGKDLKRMSNRSFNKSLGTLLEWVSAQ